MLSSFRANPRLGHLNHCKRIYGNLYKMRNAAIRIRVDKPSAYSVLPTKIYAWEQSIYTGAEELIPDDNPIPLGKSVVMTTFIDANLYHDLVTWENLSLASCTCSTRPSSTGTPRSRVLWRPLYMGQSLLLRRSRISLYGTVTYQVSTLAPCGLSLY
jgi:hypothetical protein